MTLTMAATMTLLMTRPYAASKRFVAMLPDHIRARVSVCYAPLIRIDPIVDQIALGATGALIFTSSHAVELASSLILTRDLPVFCVGRATTRAAIDAGWSAEFAGLTADALVETLSNQRLSFPILHLSGIHTRGAIAERLSAVGIQTTVQPIYDQQVVPLTTDAIARLNRTEPVIAPLFSPRTARHFAGQVQGHAPLWLAALSSDVKKQLKSLNYNKLVTCNRPDAAAMCTVVENLVNDADRVENRPDAQ